MAKGFKHGAGGVSALNFKVVGGTSQPVNPKENTIWVNTQTEISGWVFSATEPKSPVEGTVWISTGTSSTVEFNALKKNGIQVYPTSAKQYISGAWSSKTGKSYFSGNWVNWELLLYYLGDKCTDVTGGWTSYAKKSSSGDGAAASPTVTYSDNYVNIKVSASNGYPSCMFCTTNAIDLTNRSALVFDGFKTVDNVWLCVWSGIGTYTTSDLVASVQITETSRNTINMDISTLTGEYYVGLRMLGSSATPNVTMYALKAI